MNVKGKPLYKSRSFGASTQYLVYQCVLVCLYMADTVHVARSLAGHITEMKWNPQEADKEEIDLAGGQLPALQHLYPSSRTTPSSRH